MHDLLNRIYKYIIKYNAYRVAFFIHAKQALLIAFTLLLVWLIFKTTQTVFLVWVGNHIIDSSCITYSQDTVKKWRPHHSESFCCADQVN